MYKILDEACLIAKKKWKGGKGIKTALVVGGIIAGVLFLVGLLVYLVILFLKSILKGGTRNLDLYFPRAGRVR